MQQVWQSSTSFPQFSFHYVLAASLPSPFTLHLADLPGIPADASYVVFDYFTFTDFLTNSATQAAVLDASHPFVVPVAGHPALGKVPFRYFFLHFHLDPFLLLLLSFFVS